MFISTSIKYYKRSEVSEALVKFAEDKEISVMYGMEKFGKRPDVLSYKNDVLELAKKKVSSFHCSEELWHNPLSIVTGMKRHELNDLRKGWDLILDIDCPDWDFSKLTTHLFIKALQDNGVNSITVKFSGNKGFHIAVPFEAFPKTIYFEGEKKLVKDLFPEGPRKIALYLLDFITRNYVDYNTEKKEITFLSGYKFTLDELSKIAKKFNKNLFTHICPDCGKERREEKSRIIYLCENCGFLSNPTKSSEVISCLKCKYPVEKKIVESTCPHCNSKKNPVEKLNLDAVVDVDTVLISSRHLYRMPFSLHEKSKLSSIPIKIRDVLTFDKKDAEPEKIVFDNPFLDRENVVEGEATNLFIRAFDFQYTPSKKSKPLLVKKIEVPEDAIAKDFFPPCILNILKGMEDGKKRALFILINFLRSVGWAVDQIELFVYEWNELNPEPLREQYIKGQISQIKRGKQILPPPSCSNQDYYKSLLICTPDKFCSKIKNPSQYAKNKHSLDGGTKKSLTREKVIFIEYSDSISKTYNSCKKFIKDNLNVLDIQLIGSFAIPIKSREEIDILVEVKDMNLIQKDLRKKNFKIISIKDSEIIAIKDDLDIICKLYLVPIHLNKKQKYLDLLSKMKSDTNLRLKYEKLKTKYSGKTLRSYLIAKNKFFSLNNLV
ncbi:MAG: GrpB family protein [Nanoarchaeota archaeon]|nr:GrpB family protein [Nanoarchaeota archaeon]